MIAVKLPTKLSLAAVLIMLALLWAPSVSAVPADNEVELFAEPNYGGTRKVFSLGEGESQRVCTDPWATSLKVGQKVAVLIQRETNYFPEEGVPVYPEYHVFTGEWTSLPRRFAKVSGEVIIFRRGTRVGVWPNGHPDGVTFSKHRSTTVLGSGLDSELRFCGPSSAYDSWQQGLQLGTVRNRSLQWVTLYGKSTGLTAFDSAGRALLSLTTKGEDWKDFDLSGSVALKNMTRFEVSVHRIQLVPDPGPVTGPGTADTRRYWVSPGRYFLNTSGKTWDEFGAGRKAFTFTETRRTADFVEFFDTTRNLWIRLHGDRAMLLRKDDPSLKWEALFPGKWSLEEPPKMIVGGGMLPITPPASPGSGLLPPVLPSSSPNLTGAWTSNFGMTYQIQQTGPNFTWTAAMLKESGHGKFLSKDEITAQWSGSGGSGSAKGKITQSDSAGKPTRIEWSHGIVFTRK